MTESPEETLPQLSFFAVFRVSVSAADNCMCEGDVVASLTGVASSTLLKGSTSRALKPGVLALATLVAMVDWRSSRYRACDDASSKRYSGPTTVPFWSIRGEA